MIADGQDPFFGRYCYLSWRLRRNRRIGIVGIPRHANLVEIKIKLCT